MSFERYFSVVKKTWRTVYMNAHKTVILATILVAIITGINFHVNFTIDYELNENGTIFGKCVTSSMYDTWMQVDPLGSYFKHTRVFFLILFS
jgi:hypothetical protein